MTCPPIWFPVVVVSRGPDWKAPTVPRPYPPEFRARAVALVRSGKQVKQTAYELGISSGCLHEWLKQDRIDRGEITGVATSESAELRAARKRIRELERELAIVRQAAKLLEEDKPHPKDSPVDRPTGRRRGPGR